MSSEEKKGDRNAASSNGVIVNLGQDDELVSTVFELNINRSCLIAPQIKFFVLLLLYVTKFTMKKGLNESYLHFIVNKLYTPCKRLYTFYY